MRFLDDLSIKYKPCVKKYDFFEDIGLTAFPIDEDNYMKHNESYPCNVGIYDGTIDIIFDKSAMIIKEPLGIKMINVNHGFHRWNRYFRTSLFDMIRISMIRFLVVENNIPLHVMNELLLVYCNKTSNFKLYNTKYSLMNNKFFRKVILYGFVTTDLTHIYYNVNVNEPLGFGFSHNVSQSFLRDSINTNINC